MTDSGDVVCFCGSVVAGHSKAEKFKATAELEGTCVKPKLIGERRSLNFGRALQDLISRSNDRARESAEIISRL